MPEGPRLLVAVDSTWVAEREALLVSTEDEMFRAARDRATTDEERRYWEDFIALRERNLEAARRGRTP